MRSTGHPGHEGIDAAAGAVDAFPTPETAAGPVAVRPRGAGPDTVRPVGGDTGVLTRVVCAPIRLYRTLSSARPPHCRYWPSCSAYALGSIEVHGVGRGLALSARRIARCHPWGGFGADPVPSPGSRRRGA
jgi:putative membrane protein insertion efficiency factor